MGRFRAFRISMWTHKDPHICKRVQGFRAVESRVSVYSNIGTVVTARIKTQEFRRLLKHAIGEHALRYIRVTVTLNPIRPIRMTLSEPASLKNFHLEL